MIGTNTKHFNSFVLKFVTGKLKKTMEKWNVFSSCQNSNLD